MIKMDTRELQLAIASGLSMVCATCKKWAEGAEQGSEKCTAKSGCGSPIAGDTFHEYDGPITDFLRFCFVCGQPATKGIRVKGHVRLIGACNTHVDYVVRLAPKEPRHLPVVPMTILAPSGESPVEKVFIDAPKKTLAHAMLEMQKGTFKADG